MKKTLMSLAVVCCFIFISPMRTVGFNLTVTNDEIAWISHVRSTDEIVAIDFNGLTTPAHLLLEEIASPALIEDGFAYQIEEGPLDFGPLSIQANWIGTIPPSIERSNSTGIYTIDNTPFLFLRTEVDNNRRTRLRFLPRVYAFGADVGSFGLPPLTEGESFQIEIKAITGEVEVISNSMLARSFWGFVSDVPIDHVTFVGINSDGNLTFGRNFSLDNLQLAIVPETTSMALILVASILMPSWRKFR